MDAKVGWFIFMGSGKPERERQFDFEIRITETTKKRQLCQWLFVVIT